MKKRYVALCVIICLVLCLAIGVITKLFILKGKSDETVLAVVNNQKIYKSQVDIIKWSQELSRKNAKAFGTDGTEITVQSEEEILNDLIRNTVVTQEAKKQKLTANYSDAKKYVQSNYELLMSNNDENSEFLKEYMRELDLSESEYIELAAKEYQDVMMRGNLYNDFVSKNSGKQENVDDLYNEYVAELLSKADIVYK